MAMNRSGHRPGGGIASNKHVEKPVRTGTGSHSTSPGYVSQLGNKVGDHVTHSGKGTGYRGEAMHDGRDFQPTKFGNEVAAKTVCGPGGSRTVYKSGYQDTYGATNPGSPVPNARRDALEGE